MIFVSTFLEKTTNPDLHKKLADSLVMPAKASHTRKHAGKLSKSSKIAKGARSQKIRDQKSMRSLDQAMAAGALNLSSRPLPAVGPQEECWKDALKSIGSLAEQSAIAKLTKSNSKLSCKVDPDTLASLLNGIDGIKVDADTNASIQLDSTTLNNGSINAPGLKVKALSGSKDIQAQSSMESEIDV